MDEKHLVELQAEGKYIHNKVLERFIVYRNINYIKNV